MNYKIDGPRLNDGRGGNHNSSGRPQHVDRVNFPDLEPYWWAWIQEAADKK